MTNFAKFNNKEQTTENEDKKGKNWKEHLRLLEIWYKQQKKMLKNSLMDESKNKLTEYTSVILLPFEIPQFQLISNDAFNIHSNIHSTVTSLSKTDH